MDVLSAYRKEHPETYAGTWIDRASGVVVLAFTDDPDGHLEAILALVPSPADYPDVDPRSLGERADVTIDVVQVRYSQAELEAIQEHIMGAVSGRDLGETVSAWIFIRRNRVGLGLFNPPEGTLEKLAELVSDRAAVCVSVSHTPQPPSGPLDVIPDLDTEDPLVTCRGVPSVRYSQLVDPPSIDDVDHPAVDALRAELEAPGGEPMPRGRWVVMTIEDDEATFDALSSEESGYARFRRYGDKWVLGSLGRGRSCERVVVLPEGLNRVEVRPRPRVAAQHRQHCYRPAGDRSGMCQRPRDGRCPAGPPGSGERHLGTGGLRGHPPRCACSQLPGEPIHPGQHQTLPTTRPAHHLRWPLRPAQTPKAKTPKSSSTPSSEAQPLIKWSSHT